MHRVISFFGICLLGWLVYSVGIETIWYQWQNIEKRWLLLALITLAVHLWFITVKWRTLLDKAKAPGLLQLFKLRMIGAFYGTFTPANAGTVLSARYLSNQSTISLSQSAASVLIDKLLELASLGCLALIGVLILSSENFSLLLGGVLFLMTAGVLTLLWLLTDRVTGKHFLKSIARVLIPSKVSPLIRKNFLKIYAHIGSPREILWPFFLNVVSLLVSYAFVTLLAIGLQAPITLGQAVLTLPIAAAIGMIPITISGLGTRELTMVSLWQPYGISAEQTLSVMIAAFILGKGIPTFLGLVFVSRSKR